MKRSRPAVVQREGDPLAFLERGRHGLGQAVRARRRRRSSRSTTTSSSPPRVRSSSAGSSSRWWAIAVGHGRGRSRGREGSRRRLHGLSRATGGSGNATCTRPGRTRRRLVGRRLRRVPPHRRAARPAAAPADSGPEQPQVVVDLGRGADGRPARDGRDCAARSRPTGRCPRAGPPRLRHPLEELLGVGRERLDVAPLPLGVERVEGERALARAGRAGDHGERAVGQLDGDALQIVLTGVDDADDGIGTGKCVAGSSGRVPVAGSQGR